MKKNRIRLQTSFVKKRKLIARIILIAILLCVIIFALGGAWKKLKNLEFFRVKVIIVSEGSADVFLYLKGRNIFDIDIKRESRYLSGHYPTYKNIRIVRLLPNTLRIDFIKRKPMAIIKLYRYFFVDQDQTLFEIPSQQPIPDIPVITGLETKIFDPNSGKKYNLKELELALKIIKELKAIRPLRVYKVQSVDVANLASAMIFLQITWQYQNSAKTQKFSVPQTIEVKIGQEDILARIKILRVLLANIKNEIPKIQYIDLRFKEPTVRFKDAK